MTLRGISNSVEWRISAEWDWVEIGDRSGELRNDALHAVANATVGDSEWFGAGETECGLSGTLWIPGLLTRMSERRCPQCCEATGMPQGKQSPKNVDECRPVAEARIAKLREAANAA